MKNLKTFLKKGLAVLLVVLLVSRPVESAHAVATEAVIGIVVSIVSLAQSYGESASVQERQEIKDLVHDCFVSKADVSGVTVTDGEHLHEMYLELCNLGFPCEIDQVYVDNSWYYCIVGTDYVHIPNSFFGLFPDWIPLHNRVFTNTNGIAYVANYKPTSNNYLQWIWEDFGSYLSSINAHLGAIEDRLLRFYDFITGYRDNAGNMPGTNLYDKMNEMITAINGISVSGGSFDVTPIVNKLQATIDAADERLTLLLSDLGGHVSTIVQEMTANTESIVDAIPDPVDLQPVNDRIDAVVEEVQKISTFADLHEIVTVNPGVLGDVHVVTTGGWTYDYLSFFYEHVDPEFVPSADTEYIAGGWFIDYDSGTGSYIYELQDRNYYGANAVRFSAAEGYWVPSGASPVYVEVYYRDGGSLVLNVGDLTGYTPYTVSLDEVSYARIYVESGGDRWLEETGGRDLVGITYGNYDYPSTDHLSFTVDGAPHTLYFTNEYEFNSCSYGDFIWYDESQGMWCLENLYGSGGSIPLTYYNAYLTDALTSAPTTTTTIEGETYTWFEWFYTSFKGGGGSLDVTPIVNKLKDIENALANMGSNIDIENNTNINISEENENYNIFYVDDPDGGEDKSIVDLSGDTLKVFGKLLDFLYKVSFKGSLDSAGSGIGDLSDFYLDTSEGSAELWVS